jgi:hypothetical protein
MTDAVLARADAEEKEEKKESTETKADAGEVMVDKLLERLDAVCKRMDAMESGERKDSKRKDGETEAEGFKEEGVSKLDKKRGDADEEKDKERKDDDEDESMIMDSKRRKDARRKDADGDDSDGGEERKDSRADSVTLSREQFETITSEINALKSRMAAKPRSDAEYTAMLERQARADSIYSAFGSGRGAPRFLDGETDAVYRRRLINGLRKHSPRWKDIDITHIADDALGVVERDVYNDSMAAALNPPDLGEGELRERRTRTAGGHEVTEFIGRPRSWIDEFSCVPRMVPGGLAGFSTKNNH